MHKYILRVKIDLGSGKMIRKELDKKNEKYLEEQKKEITEEYYCEKEKIRMEYLKELRELKDEE